MSRAPAAATKTKQFVAVAGTNTPGRNNGGESHETMMTTATATAATPTTPITKRAGLSSHHHYQHEEIIVGSVLEPEAKLLLRMAVYRLILLDQ